MRKFKLFRKTKETDIFVKINLDGKKKSVLDTNIPFLNHMLEQFIYNSCIDLEIKLKGDLNIDFHHSIEDLGIVLGKVIKKALGNNKGINRYGLSYISFDETLTRVVIDISGRPFLKYNVNFNNNYINNFDLNLINEFFIALVNNSKITLHIKNIYGSNIHHQCESIFKAFGRAFLKAKTINKNFLNKIPSTKGFL